MTVPEDTDPLWERQAEIDACLAEKGITPDQLNRWRRAGLLPPVCQEAQAYRGSVVYYPVGTCAQIRAAQVLFRRKNRNDYVGLRLWRSGFPVDEKYWRPRLKRFGQLADRVLPIVSYLRERSDRRKMQETLQDKAARLLPSNIILSRIMGRLPNEELPIFVRVVMEMGLGEFQSFEAPSGDNKRSYDEITTIKAFDLNNAERRVILGKKFKFVDVMPLAFENTAKAFKIGNFAQAAEASAEEIAQARDDAMNALQIGFSLYDATRWIYDDGAFGLRMIAWLARKAPDSTIDGLILGMLRLRQVPNAILTSEQIAELAKQAEVTLNASKQLEHLWRTDPRFTDVLDPKRIKAALADKVMLQRFEEEVKAASMRQLNEILRGQL